MPFDTSAGQYPHSKLSNQDNPGRRSRNSRVCEPSLGSEHFKVVPGDDCAVVLLPQLLEQSFLGIRSAYAAGIRAVIEHQQLGTRPPCEFRKLER